MNGSARGKPKPPKKAVTTEAEFTRLYYDVFLKDRGPSKRQIKPANFDLLAAAFAGHGPSGADESATAVADGVAVPARANHGHTEQSAMAAWHARQPDTCCICQDDDSDDVLLCCEGPHCDVAVHLDCYGVDRMPPADEPWLCDRCAAGQAGARCALCPQALGALRRIAEADAWCHVTCAMWLRGASRLPDGGVSLADVPLRAWAQTCTLCRDAALAASGACITCDAGFCRAAMHVTCAARIGLLVEDATPDMANPHFAFCKQHSGKTRFAVQPYYAWLRQRPADDAQAADDDAWRRLAAGLADTIKAAQLRARAQRADAPPARRSPTPLRAPHDIECATCRKTYDMRELDPPMRRRPARGYEWQCADCDTSDDEGEDDEPPKDKSKDGAENGRPKRARTMH